jgi:hypothetical protein
METEPMPAEAAAVVPVLAPEVVTAGLVLGDPAALAVRLETYTKAREIFVDWIFKRLIPGTDFLLIHRKVGPRNAKSPCPHAADATSPTCTTCGGKAALAKPGSEKICGLLQLRPRFKRDIESWEMLGSEPGLVALICELTTTADVVVAEGRGARHRDQDYGDPNKCLKMCEKSAQTNAVLRCAGLSEILTQDLEDLPGGGFDNGTEAGEFAAPRRKSETTTTATPAPATLQAQLEESVRRTAPAAPDRRPTPRPTPRPAPRASAPAAPPAADGLSDARVRRLMAMLHEALRGAEVPQEQHEAVFEVARTYLVEWVGRTQGRERLSECSWRAYDELCAQVPAAVDAALGSEGPPARAHPRLVRRYGAPRSMNVPRREF